MTRDKAIRVAIDAMKQQRQKYAFDANMRDLYGETNPTAINSSKIYNELTEAIKTLEEQK
jgi:hypothetical protein